MGNGEAPWLEVLDGDWSGPLRLRVRGRSMRPTVCPGDQVTVEPVALDALRMGDWVLVRGPRGLFLHRFLGFTGGGLFLSKGDGNRAPDRPWASEALVGRAVALRRQGQTFSVSSSSLRERARTAAHWMMAKAWSFVRHVGLLVLILAFLPGIARAAVKLVSFAATSDGQVIRVTWETASEANMLGFYVQRALQEGGEYQRISDIIPARGDIVGAYYEHVDADVQLGITYYYRLEALEVTGAFELHGPISAALTPSTQTPTSTPTPTATPTPSATSTTRPRSPNPTVTPATGTPPLSGIEFWADQEEISQGQCTVLHWRVENVQAIYYEGQAVTGNEDRRECPRQHTTYALRVVTDEGEETREVTVAVQDVTASPSPTPARTPTPTSTTRVPTRLATSPGLTPTRLATSPGLTPTPSPPTAGGSLAPSLEPSPSPAASTPTRTLASAYTSPTADTPAPTQVIASRLELTVAAAPVPAPLTTQRTGGWRQWLPWGLILAMVGTGGGLILLGALGIWLLGRQR